MAWGISYYKAQDGTVPGEDFLDGLPSKIAAHFDAVLDAVRTAPPPQFSGGGYWEAMHGSMTGYFEVRKRAKNELHRLFCLLENGTEEELEQAGFEEPQIIVLSGMTKPVGTTFSDAEYRKHVRDLGDRYRATTPRPVAK